MTTVFITCNWKPETYSVSIKKLFSDYAKAKESIMNTVMPPHKITAFMESAPDIEFCVATITVQEAIDKFHYFKIYQMNVHE